MGRLGLIRDLMRLAWHRKLWFLIPLFSLLIFGGFLLVILETPALMPFFYAIF